MCLSLMDSAFVPQEGNTVCHSRWTVHLSFKRKRIFVTQDGQYVCPPRRKDCLSVKLDSCCVFVTQKEKCVYHWKRRIFFHSRRTLLLSFMKDNGTVSKVVTQEGQCIVHWRRISFPWFASKSKIYAQDWSCMSVVCNINYIIDCLNSFTSHVNTCPSLPECNTCYQLNHHW